MRKTSGSIIDRVLGRPVTPNSKPTIQPSAVVTHTKSVLADLSMLARETKASQLTEKKVTY
jgi:hypothetical protein